MNNSTPDPNQFQLINLLPTLLGGLLSIMGGFGAVVLRGRTERKNEINYIKISLTDELHEICSILEKLEETYKTTHIVSNKYLNELSVSDDSLHSFKERLFVIKNEKLRKEITSYYKLLSETITESKNKVGTLGEAPGGNEHDPIVSKFADVKAKALGLSESLKKYNYKVLWFI